MSSRKPCVNIQTASYTGKEQSPLHFGLSAEGYEINTIMEGYDHLLWIVKIKNNRKVWTRHTPNNSNMTHEEPILNSDGINENIETKHISNVETLKPKVEEKKITDYNLYLTYKLFELKKNNTDNKNNKEIFNIAITEWKELKKNPSDLSKILLLAKEHHNNKEK
jgi:hypothetical protein